MSHAPAHADAPAFDPLDPHGSTHAGGHHGHVIVPWQTQLAVLAALLALTALTVGVAQAEGWVIRSLGADIPHWVNIVGAMFIATVKAVLVCMFFMQLKYDKPLNSIVFGFCLFCVFLFLFFATLDLTSRDTIRPEKAQSISAGGTGVGLNATVQDGTLSAGLGPRPSFTGAITDFRFEQALANKYKGDPEAMWTSYYAKQAHPHRHPQDTDNYFHALGFDHADEPSSEERSRPRRGLTPGLFDDRAPDAHGASHDTPHADTDIITETEDHTPGDDS